MGNQEGILWWELASGLPVDRVSTMISRQSKNVVDYNEDYKNASDLQKGIMHLVVSTSCPRNSGPGFRYNRAHGRKSGKHHV